MLVDAKKEEYLFISTNVQDNTCKFGGSFHGSKFLMENKQIVKEFFMFCKDNYKKTGTINPENDKEMNFNKPYTRQRAAKRKAQTDDLLEKGKKIFRSERIQNNLQNSEQSVVIAKSDSSDSNLIENEVKEQESLNPCQDLELILHDIKKCSCENMLSDGKLGRIQNEEKSVNNSDKKLPEISNNKYCSNKIKALEEKDEIDEDYSDDNDPDFEPNNDDLDSGEFEKEMKNTNTNDFQTKPKTIKPIASMKFNQNHRYTKKTLERSGRITVSCRECQKRVPIKALSRHLRFIHGIKQNTFTCQKCKKDFSEAEEMNKHEVTCSEMVLSGQENDVIKPETTQGIHACTFCVKVLESEEALQRHMTIHNQNDVISDKTEENHTANTGSDVEPCTSVGKTVLESTDMLKNNMHVELSSMLINCNTCGKQFYDLDQYNEHRKVHQIPCKDCGETIPIEVYANHQRSVHKILNAFKCKRCNKGFNSCFSLRKHENFCNEIVLDTETIKTEENLVLSEIDEYCVKIIKEGTMDKSKTSSSDSPMLTCTLCLKVLKSQKSLDNHMKIHANDENLTCKICGKKFVTNYRLRIHEGTHETEKKFKCPLCPAKFTLGGRAINHVRTKHKDDRVACSKCCLLFDSVFDKNQHDMMEHNQYKCNNFICKKCGRGYETVPKLNEHNKACHNGSEVICRVCGELFPTAEELENHMTGHNADEDATKCNICKKSFPTTDDLRSHKEKEHNSTIFCCETCGDFFNSSLDYKKHQLYVHQTESPYKCDYCDKRFKEKKRCTQHMRIIHMQSQVFQCEECGLCLKTKDTLKNHSILHKVEHPHPCQYCQDKFRSSAGLSDHILAKHQSLIDFQTFKYRVHKCEYCDFKTVNKIIHLRHERTHTGYRPFQCQFCEKKFSIESNLIRHVRSKHDDSAKRFSCQLCDRHYAEKSHFDKHCKTKKHQVKVKIANNEPVPKDLVTRRPSKKTNAACGKKQKADNTNEKSDEEALDIQSTVTASAVESISVDGEVQYTIELNDEQNLSLGNQEIYIVEEGNTTDLASMIDIPVQVGDGSMLYIISNNNQ